MTALRHAAPARAAGREVLLDARGDGRALRVTAHPEAGLIVLSLWHDEVCAGTFRLPVGEVPALVAALAEGLDASYDALRGRSDTAC